MTQEEFDNIRAGMSPQCLELLDAVEARMMSQKDDLIPDEVFRVLVVNETMREWVLR